MGGNRDVIFSKNISRTNAHALGEAFRRRIRRHAPHSGFRRYLVGTTRRFLGGRKSRFCVLTKCP